MGQSGSNCESRWSVRIPWIMSVLRRFKLLLGFFYGTFVESFDAVVTSDGAVITMTLEQSGGGDLTMVFSDGHTVLDCTPTKASIALTAGTDPAPQLNYVYILQTTKVLTVSTSDWPATEHIKVALLFVQTAALVNTGAAGLNWGLINQNWNDHSAGTDNQGHMSHMAELARRGGPGWRSGCLGTATQDGNDLWVGIAAGVSSQMHKHTFAALDSDTAGAGDPIVVVNDPDAAFTMINSLNSITKVSDGDAIGVNKFLTFVLWGVINKSGEPSPMMLNLPSEFYNTQAEAEADASRYVNFSVPAEFRLESSTGFLVAAFTCQHTATAMDIKSTVDLRGQVPNNASLGGVSAGGGDVTAAAVMTDNAIVRGDGGAKGVQDTGILVDDSDNLTSSGNISGVNLISSGFVSVNDGNKVQLGSSDNYLQASVADNVQLNAVDALELMINGTSQLTLEDGVIFGTTDNDIDLGKATTNWFKDVYLKGKSYFDDTDTHVYAASGALIYSVAAAKEHQLNVAGVAELIIGADYMTFKSTAQRTGFDWSTSGILTQTVVGVGQISLADGALYGVTDNDIDLGVAVTNWFKDGYLKGNFYFDNTSNKVFCNAGILMTVDGSVGVILSVGGTTALNINATSCSALGFLQGTYLRSTIAIGTAPLVVTSTTKVANLNSDLLDGNEATGMLVLDGIDNTPTAITVATDPVMALVLSSTTGISAVMYEAWGYMAGAANSENGWTIAAEDPDNVVLSTTLVKQDTTGAGDYWNVPFYICGYDSGPGTGATGYHLDCDESFGGSTLHIVQTKLTKVLS